MTNAATPDTTAAVGPEDWPLRPWLFAIGLALAALLFHFFVAYDRIEPWRAAAAAFVGFGTIAAALTVERRNWREPLVFAGGLGLIMAGLAWRAAGFGNHWGDEQYGFAAGTIAALLAVPLFQAQFHRRRFATPYIDTHFNVWSDVISVGGALAFVLLSFLTVWLLSALFMLLKIRVLRDLMNRDWFDWLFAGAAFGAALCTLRGELKVLGTLQRVVMLVLAILTVPLAAALIVFLLATLTSGPAVLWSATRSATPVLLACAAGSFVLVNAILRDGDEDMTRSRIQRIAALVLALGIAPLTLFATASMGTRVAQHGLSPERLWGLAAIAVAVAYGLGYFVAALRGRRAWPDAIRAANLRLAVGTLGFALLLALPLLDFGAIAARQQVGRLQAGRIAATAFDFDALRWEFGGAGRRALGRLASDRNPAIATPARAAMAERLRRWASESAPEREERRANLQLPLASEPLRGAFRDYLGQYPYRCRDSCNVIDLGKGRDGHRRFALVDRNEVTQLEQQADGKIIEPGHAAAAWPRPKPGAARVIEVRDWSGKQIWVDGRPLGDPFQ